MEEDKLKDLFGKFQPELSSPMQFMEKLQKNMDAVEFVKQQTVALKKRNRLAVAIAAASGFAVGVVLTLLFPMIVGWISSFSISMPHLHISNISIEYNYIAWVIMAGASILTSLSVYDLALAKLSPKQS